MSVEAMKQWAESVSKAYDLTAWGHTERAAEILRQTRESIRTAIAEAEKQEPVAHQDWCASLTQLLLSNPPKPAPCNCTPPAAQRQPLTDDQIDAITDAQWARNNHKPIYAAHRAYARAIEAAHGIGGKA